RITCEATPARAHESRNGEPSWSAKPSRFTLSVALDKGVERARRSRCASRSARSSVVTHLYVLVTETTRPNAMTLARSCAFTWFGWYSRVRSENVTFTSLIVSDAPACV